MDTHRLTAAGGSEPSRDSGIKRRAIGAFLGLQIGDARGVPVEFRRRGTFARVVDMFGGGTFSLPPGAWTDDTVMALGTSNSLIFNPALDARDLLERVRCWADQGENASTGRAVGIGQNTPASLGTFAREGILEVTRRGAGRSDGTGALMRLARMMTRHWQNSDLAAYQTRRDTLATI